MQKIIVIIVCWCWLMTASAQPNITRVEYFIDTDPGFGNATSVPITPSANISNGNFTVTLSSLPVGIHALFIRSRDANGKWSVTNSRFFYRPSSNSSSSLPNITKAEYFFDTDPGFGNATNIPVTAGPDLQNIGFTASIGALPAGIHALFVRSRDANGKWSVTNSRFFYKPSSGSSSSLPNITKAEYFFDTDPGFGNAVNIPITAGPNVQNIVFTAGISTLSEGVHALFLRSRDANGRWSVTNARFFYKPAPLDSTIFPVTNVEYFIDTDPGFGKATPIAVNPSYDLANFMVPVNISGLSVGDHKLFIRSRSATGYSITNTYTFPIAATASTPYINVNSITKKVMCARDSVKVSFDAQGTYNAGNVFKVELSNATGTFAATPPVIGTYTGINSVIVSCQLPSHTADGTSYRVRVSSTNPVVTGVAGSDAITIHDRPYAQTITGDANVNAGFAYPYSVPAATGSEWAWIAPAATITQTANSASLLWNTVGQPQMIKVIETNQYGCVGDTSSKNVNVYPLKITGVTPSTFTPCPDGSFTVSANTYGVYYSGNTFTAQLSDAAGSFASPVAIGVLTSTPQPVGNAQPLLMNVRLPIPLANGTNYRIRIVSSNYAVTSDTSAAMVVDKPELGPDQSRIKCPGFPVDLTTIFNTIGLTVNWNVARPDNVIDPGTYILIVTNSNGCKDTASVVVSNYPQPVAGFTVNNDQQCEKGNDFSFTNKSSISSGSMTYMWSFGDNSTSTSVSPSHSYATSGNYTVQLISVSNNGCKDTAVKMITVNASPNLGADKTVSKCAGSTTDITGVYNTTGLTAEWNTQNPSAVDTGMYRLIVTNGSGCKDTAFVTVSDYPKPDLGADKAITKYSGEKTDLNSLFNTSGLTVQWNTANPSAADTGTYRLIVTSSNGCKDTAMVVITNYSHEYLRSITSGDWSNKNTWQASTDSVSWTGSVAIPTRLSTATTIQNHHTVTVTGSVTADHTYVSPGGILSSGAGGALTVINNGLTLKSNADSSAAIGQSSGTITGNVMVERFIPARRAWRLMTVPFSSSQTINAAWQEGGMNIPGYGTHITGGSAANGFDQSPTNNSSIKRFNQPNNTFDPLASTLTPLTNQPGYFLFVRGDRTVDLAQGTSAPATNTILRAMGTLKMGTQPAMPVAATGFTLVGNPYASAIDFAAITKTNVPARFYLWDPKRANVGAYVLFDAADGYAPMNDGGSYTGSNSIIQSGQAFFVEGSGDAGSLGIGENSKSTEQRNVFRTNDGKDEKLRINLIALNTDNSTTLVDGALEMYNNLYSPSVTSEDAGKPDNIDENVGIVRSGRVLMEEKRPLLDDADTIFLKLYNMKAKEYEFEITPSHFTAPLLSAYLEDTYLGTSAPVSLSMPVKIKFSITADAASANPYRFRIVFKTSGALPLLITKVKGYQKDAGIQVDWNVSSEDGINHYEVEKSADGRQFTKATNVTAIGNAAAAVNYGWFDANPLNGYNYYRIKAVSNSGECKYSEIVNVKTGNTKSSIVVYPNPVTSRTVFVQFNNQPKGRYSIQLFNNLGQQLINTIIEHPGGSMTETIPLSNLVSKGIYQLYITNGESKITTQVVIQ